MHNLRLRSRTLARSFLLLATLSLVQWTSPAPTGRAGRSGGLRAISGEAFPAPAETKAIPVPGGDFETAGEPPPGWTFGNAQVVVADDAPQGKAYCRLEA